jgi:hypothetical protein
MTLQPLPYGYRALHGEALLANGFGSCQISGAASCEELSSDLRNDVTGFRHLKNTSSERAGYDFRLNSTSSRMITPGGDVVPLVRDLRTGFHFIVDHFRAKPVLERKISRVVTHECEKGQALDRRFNLEDAKPAPSGPDTAEGINELLSLNFGSEFTWTSRGHDAHGACSEQRVLSGSVVWANLGKDMW